MFEYNVNISKIFTRSSLLPCQIDESSFLLYRFSVRFAKYIDRCEYRSLFRPSKEHQKRVWLIWISNDVALDWMLLSRSLHVKVLLGFWTNAVFTLAWQVDLHRHHHLSYFIEANSLSRLCLDKKRGSRRISFLPWGFSITSMYLENQWE